MSSKSNFRINSKSVFLTFSQCDYPLKDFRDNIEKYFGNNLEKGVVSQEKHKDGVFICTLQYVYFDRSTPETRDYSTN